MKTTKLQTKNSNLALGKQRSYNEVVEFLDTHWPEKANSKDTKKIKQLDMALESPSKKLDTILVTGTNGKSLTMHFATKLLKEEGISVGTLYSPHILTYNERFSLNGETIANKAFTEIANEVINAAQIEGLTPNSPELLTVMGFLYFTKNNVDVALLEVCEKYSQALNICNPKIAAITRVMPDDENIIKQDIEKKLAFVQPGTWVISADQSKINLQSMLELSNKKGGKWAMPIRKLAPLAYPFEQLHGRCAALAERVSHIYINQIANKDGIIVGESLLTKPKAQRGRPTLEAKRQAELNPQKTLDQFWKEDHCTLPARFQVLDKEKPTIMLDTASNLDAFKNLLLGIRLLHYQRPLKGLTIILGLNNPSIAIDELLKQLRYFFKKTSGQIIVCPSNAQPGQPGEKSCDIEKITNDLKSMKIKASSAKNLNVAFEAATKTVDERYGLVVVTGSTSIITQYWRDYKGMKKL
ncbi:hypothetical protein KAH94_01395 [bacterium]|nr:hypothetical protein [bacterium]